MKDDMCFKGKWGSPSLGTEIADIIFPSQLIWKEKCLGIRKLISISKIPFEKWNSTCKRVSNNTIFGVNNSFKLRLRSFGVCQALLKTFYDSVLSSVILLSPAGEGDC